MNTLKKETLSLYEVVAQSVANIAPSATPALIIPLVFASAGNGTWIAYAIATVAMLFVAAQINMFASRSSSPGALYTFTNLGLGPRWGLLSGWALFLAYIFTASATLAGFANYAAVLLEAWFHIKSGTGINFIFMFLDIAVCCYIARRDIQLSTRAMLLFEFAAVGLIVYLAVMFFAKSGHASDPIQLSAQGMTSQGLRMALVLALFSFVGFESATALGHEAKNPLKAIPKSVMFSVILVGLFFTGIAYTLVVALRGGAVPLDKSASPLVDLANVSGLPGLGIPLAIGALVGQFACALACINAASRVMYSMADHGFFHSSAKQIHSKHATPHKAVVASCVGVAVFAFVLLFAKIAVMDIFGYLGSIATFGFLLSYVLVSIAAPVFLYKRGELTIKEVASTLAALVLLAVPIIGSVYPVPDAPYNYLPYAFAILVAGGVGRILWLRKAKVSPAPI